MAFSTRRRSRQRKKACQECIKQHLRELTKTGPWFKSWEYNVTICHNGFDFCIIVKSACRDDTQKEEWLFKETEGHILS